MTTSPSLSPPPHTSPHSPHHSRTPSGPSFSYSCRGFRKKYTMHKNHPLSTRTIRTHTHTHTHTLLLVPPFPRHSRTDVKTYLLNCPSTSVFPSSSSSLGNRGVVSRVSGEPIPPPLPPPYNTPHTNPVRFPSRLALVYSSSVAQTRRRARIATNTTNLTSPSPSLSPSLSAAAKEQKNSDEKEWPTNYEVL